MTEQIAQEERTKNPARRLRWVVAVLVFIGLAVGTLGNQLRAQDWDPQYTRNIIERVEAFGGTFYENGIFNKGPLEPLLHKIAALVTSYDGYWYAIAGLTALMSLLLALAGARTARFAGGSPVIGAMVGAVVFVIFTFSDADFAGVMYMRNITVTLLAGSWLLMLSEWAWETPRRRLISAIGIAFALGLAVQSLLTTVFAAGVVMIGAFKLLRDRAPAWERIRIVGAGFLAVDVAILSAPVWYWLRGAFEEFWAGWYVHARYMSSGTGRSLPNQFGLAWDNFYAYYQVRPTLFAIVGVFAVAMWVKWKDWDRRSRVVHATAFAWWAASWVELALSQRYSSHYFAVTAVPTMIMAALLVGMAFRALRPGRPRLQGKASWVVVAVLVTVYLSGAHHTYEAVRRTIGFRGAAAEAVHVENNYDGNSRTSRAILDLVSEAGDPLLAWTNAPWPYLSMDRVSATRFQWKSFLFGEIYLGNTSLEYVLPDSWDWFSEDLDQSRPVVFAEVHNEVDRNSQFGAYAVANFRPVYAGTPIKVWLRTELADEILDSRSGEPWQPRSGIEAGSGWATASATARFETTGGDIGMDTLPFAGTCDRIEGSLAWDEGSETGLAFFFDDTTGQTERLHIGVERSKIFSSSDFVLYEETELEPTNDPIRFTLFVGSRSAALVVDTTIVAALRLPQSVQVSVQPRAATVVIDGLSVGQSFAASGCG